MAAEEEDILNVDEAAVLLKITKSTLYKLVHRKTVPFKKVGGSLRFSRHVLLEWVASGEK